MIMAFSDKYISATCEVDVNLYQAFLGWNQRQIYHLCLFYLLHLCLGHINPPQRFFLYFNEALIVILLLLLRFLLISLRKTRELIWLFPSLIELQCWPVYQERMITAENLQLQREWLTCTLDMQVRILVCLKLQCFYSVFLQTCWKFLFKVFVTILTNEKYWIFVNFFCDLLACV